MAISQVEVRGRITLPNNNPATIQSVTFALLNSDFENDEWVPKHTITATPGTDGQFTVMLWPNDVGDKGNTRYRVTVSLANGASVDTLPNLFIRDLPDGQSHEIDDLIIEQTTIIAGYTNRLISATEYANLTSYTPGTLYLVRI